MAFKRKKSLRKFRLKDWLFLGLFTVLAPLLAILNYDRIRAAIGGSSATPVAYWAFDEGVDNTCSGGSNDACDSTDGGHDGAFGSDNTRPTWQTADKCVSGNCVYMDGGDSIRVPDHAELRPTSVVSMTAWAKVMTIENKTIFRKGQSAVAESYILDINSGNWRFVIRNTSNSATVLNSGVSVVSNKWTHLAAVYDGSNMLLYINGVLVGTQSAVGVSLSQSTTGLALGSAPDRDDIGLHGYLDEMKIFDTALSAAQVKAEYAGGAAVLGSQTTDFLNEGLLGYWPMDDGVSGDAQTITDKSGNGKNATTSDGANNSGMDCTVTGRFGYVCEFDGDDDDATISNISVGTSDFTLAAWIQTSLTDRAQGILSYDGTSRFRMAVATTGNIRYGIYGDSSWTEVASGPTVNNGQWHHVAVTFDRDSLATVFVDGVPVGTLNISSKSSINISASVSTRIGLDAYIGGSYFEGAIDEARIYTRALSPDEVQQLYNWAPGPVGYWKLDEKVSGNGETIFDSSGNSINGTTDDGANNTGMDCNLQGKFGGACQFDGTDDVVSVGDVATVEFGTGDFTLMGWINHPDPSSASGNAIIGKRPTGGAGTVNGYALQIHSGAIRFAIDNDDGGFLLSSAGTVNANTWHHIAVSVDRDSSTGAKIYLDGVPVGTADPTGVENSLDNSSGFAIGMNTPNGTGNFNGIIDEAKAYNYARTPQQIVEDMNGGHPTGGSPVGSQVSYFSFDEQHGETINNRGLVGSESVGTKGGSSTTGESDDPTWKTQSNCKINGCLSFDGGDYVDLSGDNNYQIANKTITFWANPGTFGTTTPVISTGGANWYAGFSSANQMFTSHATGSGSQQTTGSGANVYVSNQWSHFAYSFSVSGDNVTIKMYVNGREIRSTSYTTGYSSSYGNSLVIGAFSSNSFFYTGSLDEFKFYNSVLTPDQIKIDMNQGASLNFGGGVDGSSDTISGAITPPVAHWDFNEKVSGDTQTLLDKSGNGYNLTTVDGANNTGLNCSAPGKYGSSCLFDGADDYATLANPSFDDFGTGDMSVSAWVKYTSTPSVGYVIIGNKTAGTNNAGFSLEVNSSNLAQMRVANGSAQVSAVSSGVTNNDGQWHHLVGVFERGSSDRVLIYVDGRLISTGTAAATGWNISSSQDLLLGAYGTSTGNGNFDGNIDDVKIYDYALTASQVAYEFNRGEPIAWFKMDECTGTTLNDAGALPKTDLTLNIGSSGSNTSAGDCSSGTGTESWNNGTTGKYNSALDLDGTDDYATYAGQIVDSPLEQVSFSAWVNPDTVSGTHTIIEQISGAIQMIRSGSQWRVDVRNASTTVSATGGVATAGVWSHVTGVYDGANVKLYVDGKFITEASLTGSLFNASQNFIVGCDGNTSNECGAGTYFDGTLDDMRIYGYALSDEQVKREFNEGKAVRF